MDNKEEIFKYAKIQYISSANLEKRQNLWTFGYHKVPFGNWMWVGIDVV